MTTQTNGDPRFEHDVLLEEPTADDRVERRLDRIEGEMKRLDESTRRTNTAYGIFAAFAVVVALANLVAVAAKLGGKETTRTVTVNAPAAAAPAAVHASRVTMREFTIAPAPASVLAGKTTFTVNNAGNARHEFVVLRTNKPAGSLLKGNEADETGNVGEIGDLPPGSTKTLSLNLKKGHYALICNLPGHYKAGQHADLTVR
jgi:uncharacterized cupredoxin-like copper-binding protein